MTAAATIGSRELARPAAALGLRRLSRRFAANRLAVVGLVYIVGLVVVAIFAPALAPDDPNAQALMDRFNADTGLLGADDFGRDQFSRLLFGARVSLVAGLIAVGVAAGIGVPLGLVAGYQGRVTDAIVSRASDALQSVPALIFALTVIAVLGPGLVNAMIAVGIVTTPRFFRVARAAALEVRGEPFIEAAQALGCGSTSIMWRHVFPNTLPALIVQLSMTYAAAITAEASLSFLGLGVQVPTASWGSMLAAASKSYSRASYMIVAPGVAIGLTVLAFMLVGDGLSRAFGTRQVTDEP